MNGGDWSGYLAANGRLLGTLALALVLFGLWFNTLISRLGDTKDGYVSLLVAFGTGVTLLAVAIVSWPSALLTLAAFILSGTPMILGDIQRAMQARQAAIERMRQEAHHD